jgi:hypothetical protein
VRVGGTEGFGSGESSGVETVIQMIKKKLSSFIITVKGQS